MLVRKPWLAHYPPGVKPTVDTALYASLEQKANNRDERLAIPGIKLRSGGDKRREC